MSERARAGAAARSPLRHRRRHFPRRPRSPRHSLCSAAARRRHPLADHRLAAGTQAPSASAFLTTQSWNPVTEKFGALAPIYGTLVTSLIAMLIGIPVSLGIAIFLTELCPLLAAPADRHGDRAARRHPLDHLRHLGPVRFRAVPAGDAAALADRPLRRDSGPVVAVCRAALRHRRAHRRAHPRDHGAAVHHRRSPATSS